MIRELKRSRALETAKIIHNLLDPTLNLDVQVEIADSNGFDFRDIADQPPSDEDKQRQAHSEQWWSVNLWGPVIDDALATIPGAKQER